MTFDPVFQDQKCAATGALSHTVDVKHTGDKAVITTERQMPTDGFPDFLKSFVGSSLKVVQIDSWDAAAADGSRHGTIDVSIAGTPLKFAGTLSLTAGGSGSLGVVDGDLKASVPLIGGKVEKAAAPAVMAAVRAEQETADHWFAEQG
ncbi:MAG: hypothetical protein JWM76_3496 [Pseudonocardiales bacterium]|nr:hypothetical protein [Pseudonocardiales bacterium]